MSRPLSEGEVRLARSVFGEAVDYAKVRLARQPWGRTAVALGSLVLFPDPPADFSREALGPRAWFVHEMAHVQQFQSAPLRTAWSWLVTLLTGGYGPGSPGYRYAAPLRAWGAYNLEQQASMAEHAYVLREQGSCVAAPAGLALADYEGCVPYLARTSPGS
jgi:hypothetical protein